ncbi:MAG: sce7726 family protein [Lachnospiraceae bacterium]|nr:sce7726 family protein [Lachnospiraceae bacterium]
MSTIEPANCTAGRKKETAALKDKDIREPLFDFLEESFGKIRIFEEKRMGGSRADVIMVTPGAVVGIEIKSDADSYTRLRTQVEDYDRYFDQNYVVVGTSHAFHIEEHVPEYWGVITVEREAAEKSPDFYVLRTASINPNMHRKQKLSLLWRPELVHIQELNDMPKYAGKSKEFVIDKILACVPEETLAPQISEELFERDYSTILETINEYRLQHGQKKRRKRRRRKYKPI